MLKADKKKVFQVYKCKHHLSTQRPVSNATKDLLRSAHWKSGRTQAGLQIRALSGAKVCLLDLKQRALNSSFKAVVEKLWLCQHSGRGGGEISRIPARTSPKHPKYFRACWCGAGRVPERLQNFNQGVVVGWVLLSFFFGCRFFPAT